MNEQNLARICLAISATGIILFIIFYAPEFEEKSIKEMLESDAEKTGIIFGRVDYVIKNTPSTSFILNDGSTILIYFPKQTELKKNDFVKVYGTTQEYGDQNEIYAYKLVVEK
ncbi:MAG: hypothetical protein WC874_00170 [Candidatus Izemoplasmatales bacterium]|jgi:hypothetical protein